MAKSYHYTVSGHWPFPTDMLRKDESTAATVEDADQITDLSGDYANDRSDFENVEIKLTGPLMPAVERWNTFGWKVLSIDQYSGTIHRSLHVHPPVEAQVPGKKRRVPGGIDLTPTWKAVMPVIIAALEDGTETGKVHARAELMRAAAILDNMNAGLPGKED